MPVTARDFEFALKRVFTDDPNCDIMPILSSIRGADKALEGDISALSVSCPDDFTLRLELENKNRAIIEAFTHHRLFPCNEQFFNSTSGRYGLAPELMLYNGSFLISSWGESSVKLIKNTNAPYDVTASGVTLYQPKNTREHVALLKEGDIDAANLNFEKMNSLKGNADFSAQISSSCVWALVFNESDPLWQNENLRKAVLHCTDRSVFNNINEHISPASRLFSKNTLLFSKNYLSLTKNVSTPAFNSEEAKVLYSAALTELEMSKIYNTPVLVVDSQIYKDSFSALNQVFQRDLSL